MIISILKAVFLGTIEGATEFLPISSTGHLIIANQWVNFSEPFTTMFDIVIQLGAIVAVAAYFRKRLWPFGKDRSDTEATISIWKKALIGVMPAIIIGALLGKTIEEKLFNPIVVACALVIGGAILIYIEKKKPNRQTISVNEMPLRTAFYIGMIQCLAMIPGTSRAAATIIGAMTLGASRTAATEFSFFLAIPTMVAASGYSLLKHGTAMSGSEMITLAVGFITSFFVALAAVKFLITYIEKHDFKMFGWYRIALGIIILIILGM